MPMKIKLILVMPLIFSGAVQAGEVILDVPAIVGKNKAEVIKDNRCTNILWYIEIR